MARQTKGELDALIAKAGIGARSARKLHEANGTSNEASTASPTQQPRGHGSAAPAQPDLGEF